MRAREVAATAAAVIVGVALAAGSIRHAAQLKHYGVRLADFAGSVSHTATLSGEAYLDLWRGRPRYFVTTGIDGTLVRDARIRALESKGVDVINMGCEGGHDAYNAVIRGHFGVR